LVNHHSIAIKAPAARVFRELLIWGESEWWPADSPMRYTRLTDGEVGVGTRYHQKVHVPFGPEWDVEVVSVSLDESVCRKFLNGMFKGIEKVCIVPNGRTCVAHFIMDFEVSGAWNRLLWALVFRRKHDENIKKILNAMKGHIEGNGLK
jgi:hypothetical protein